MHVGIDQITDLLDYRLDLWSCEIYQTYPCLV